MPRVQRLDRSELRTRLEDAGARCFTAKGYANTTVDEIVEEAGVSKPALYRLFESKKHLHMALLEQHADALAAAALAPLQLDAGHDVTRQLPAMADAWFQYVEEHPYTGRMLFQDTTGDPDVQRLHSQIQERQRSADAALIREFLPELPEAEIAPLAEVIRSSLYGLALWWSDHPETPRSVLTSVVLRLVDGLLSGSA